MVVASETATELKNQNLVVVKTNFTFTNTIDLKLLYLMQMQIQITAEQMNQIDTIEGTLIQTQRHYNRTRFNSWKSLSFQMIQMTVVHDDV